MRRFRESSFAFHVFLLRFSSDFDANLIPFSFARLQEMFFWHCKSLTVPLILSTLFWILLDLLSSGNSLTPFHLTSLVIIIPLASPPFLDLLVVEFSTTLACVCRWYNVDSQLRPMLLFCPTILFTHVLDFGCYLLRQLFLV